MESRMQQHGSKYFACGPNLTPDPWGTIKRSKFIIFFSEYGCVLYQMEGNDECLNIPHRPPGPCCGVKRRKFIFPEYGQLAY